MITCSSFSANAISLGGTLTCVDAKVTSQTVISYVIKSTASARLASDILYNDGTGPIIISSFNVAQYVSTNVALGMLLDDNLERPVISFQAALPKLGGVNFSGAIQKLDPVTGKVLNNRFLKCKIQ